MHACNVINIPYSLKQEQPERVAVTERPAIYLLGVFYFSRGSMVQEKQSWCCCGGQKENVRVISFCQQSHYLLKG
jgi:hypothetical protein